MTKRFFIAFFAMCMVATALWADDKYAEAKFTVKCHDFGTIKEANGPVSCNFEFTNTGDKPLLIIDATASCAHVPSTHPSPSSLAKKGKSR